MSDPDATLLRLCRELTEVSAQIEALWDACPTLEDERIHETEITRLQDQAGKLEGRIHKLTPATTQGWCALAQVARLNASRTTTTWLASEQAQDLAWRVVAHVGEGGVLV